MNQDRGCDDRALGMGCAISRRDFLDGVAQAVGGAAAVSIAGVAGAATAAPAGTAKAGASADIGPAPARQGLRGFENAAMEMGHAVRDGKGFGPAAATGETYDLVIVGAGMSGLSAAWFYRRQRPGARILLLDGCDDFGGHARRVEFDVGGRQLLVCGGTQELWNVNTFSPESLRLLDEIGIDRERWRRHQAADGNALLAQGLRPATFYNREDFGVDRLVVNPSLQGITAEKLRAYYDTTPLAEPVKAGMVRYFTDATDHMAGLAVDEKIRRLRRMSFIDYLRDVAKLPAEAVAYHAAGWGNDMDNTSAGFDTMSAWAASRVYPTPFAGLGLPRVERRSNVAADPGEMIQFPDGNAGVARLLIRHLVPGSLPGSTAEDSIRASMRYDRLDQPGNEVRIRLSSMVVHAAHVGGNPDASREVEVTYVRDGRAQRVRAKAAVMACFNAMVPHLVPGLPAAQKAALHQAVRKPQVRCFVALRNWKALQQLGVYSIGSRGMPFTYTTPWIMPEWGGAYANARSPEEPVILFMNLARHVLQQSTALPPRERWKAARAALQALSFDGFERDIRSQLNRMLGPGGFDAARDIAGITVCRWAHGYAGGSNELFDPDWTDRADAPWVVGRRRFGRIAIANSDAAATSLTNAAFAQGHRAVMEIVNDLERPVYDFRWSERDGGL